jgi:hypothetical protein
LKVQDFIQGLEAHHGSQDGRRYSRSSRPLETSQFHGHTFTGSFDLDF